MYRFSRAMYRALAPDIVEGRTLEETHLNHERVLRACEGAVERLATDGHYFARPARTLFNDIRIYFPMRSQRHVYQVVERYLGFTREFLERQPKRGFDLNGNPLQCRATTRKGTACQRMPLPHNGYCPSHQHLADTEQVDSAAAA
jgi:hypothetical protein